MKKQSLAVQLRKLRHVLRRQGIAKLRHVLRRQGIAAGKRQAERWGVAIPTSDMRVATLWWERAAARKRQRETLIAQLGPLGFKLLRQLNRMEGNEP